MYITCAFILKAQVITTVAGGGTGGLGDGGPATSATIGYTPGISFDMLGNLYIGDPNNGRIRKVSAVTGIISTVAGTGITGYNGDGISATLAKLSSAACWVTVDAFGNLYIDDAGNYRIRKVDVATGIITTIAGNGSAGYGGDGGPATNAEMFEMQGIAIDNFGNLYINDGGNYRVRKVDSAGIITTIAGIGMAGNRGDGGLATAATISGMLGLTVDITGNVFCTDSSCSIRKINVSTGIITRMAGLGDHGSPSPYSGDSISATTCRIGGSGICIDNIGNVYIADYSNQRIEKVDTLGITYTVAGIGTSGFSGDGGYATMAKISYPENVTLDNCGNLYIADYNNRRIRKVTIPSSLTTALVTIIAYPSDTLCSGLPITFTATATLGGSSPAYKWVVNGDTLTVSSGTYSYVPTAGDSMQCILFSSSPCAAPAVVGSNVIHIVPRNVSVSLTGPGAAALGSSVTIGATVTGAATGGYTLQWSNKGVYMSTTTMPSLTYTKTMSVDSITVKLIATFGDCSDTAESGVHVVVDSVTSTPGPFSTSGEGVTCYPSPATNDLNISNVPLKCTYQLHNIIGTTVAHGFLNAGNNTLSLHELPPGLYMLEIVGEDGVREVRKVVKE